MTSDLHIPSHVIVSLTFTTLLEDNLTIVTKSLPKDLAIPYLRLYPEEIIRNGDKALSI